MNLNKSSQNVLHLGLIYLVFFLFWYGTHDPAIYHWAVLQAFILFLIE